MPNYFVITDKDVIDLGFFISNSEAEDCAIEKLNLITDSHAWLVLTSQELKQLIEKSIKCLKETDT